MKINVTQEDIDNGLYNDHKKCPIALAFIREYPHATDIDVDRVTVRFALRQFYYTIALPVVAQDFIERFDARETVMPFEFEVAPNSMLSSLIRR